jgi:CBS domain-containing protein
MRVHEAMTADVITVGPGVSVREAARLMSDHGVSGLPVVDTDGRLLGLITEGDLILRQAAPRAKHWWQSFLTDSETLAREYQKARGVTVGEVMTRAVVSVHPALPIEAAARIMQDRGVRRLPVVRDDRLVGILSRGDLIKVIAAEPVRMVMASDGALARTMRDRLEAEPWTPIGIVVEARDGVIRLSGVAATDTERSALESMARAIPGCHGVDNHVIVGGTVAYAYGAP